MKQLWFNIVLAVFVMMFMMVVALPFLFIPLVVVGVYLCKLENG